MLRFLILSTHHSHYIPSMKLSQLSFLFVAVIALSCKKNNSEPDVNNSKLSLPENPFNYEQLSQQNVYTDAFTQAQNNTPSHNPVTNWGATLGRVLFYDNLLSINQTISCSSCHQQEFAFSDTATLSVGFGGGTTGRHSMGLINAQFYASGRFFWDERAATLEDQVLMPIQDPVEMGMHLDTLVKRLRNTNYYPSLFESAFGDSAISAERISLALAQFVRSITSGNTRFDKAIGTHEVTEPFPTFSAQENLGKEIFFGSKNVNCSSCHITRAFVGDTPRNNGVRNGDLGAYATHQIDQLKGAFKAPSLINISRRPPYMHNGSIKNLMEVVEHYNSRLNNFDQHLDPHLFDTTGNPMKMNLTQQEKEALVAFMKTLDDEQLLTHEAYSNPFVGE